MKGFNSFGNVLKPETTVVPLRKKKTPDPSPDQCNTSGSGEDPVKY